MKCPVNTVDSRIYITELYTDITKVFSEYNEYWRSFDQICHSFNEIGGSFEGIRLFWYTNMFQYGRSEVPEIFNIPGDNWINDIPVYFIIFMNRDISETNSFT